MKKCKVGILGGAGYTGGELIRLLINHPFVEIGYIHSNSNAGNFVYEVHTDLLGDTDLKFVNATDESVDVVFLCLGHGESIKRIDSISKKVKVIDLSQDFRLNSEQSRPFVYGLPELNKEQIKKAHNVANPGCFATAIQLALLPLASENKLPKGIQINATTGSTGAGQSLSSSSHFTWRQNNASVYKPFEHQHLAEINKSLTFLQASFSADMLFIPQRGTFTRGIMACVTLTTSLSIEALKNTYAAYYRDHPFVHVSDKAIDLKQVVNTNKCVLYIEKYKEQLLIVSVIDNLLKGASGQAVQNMNLMFGFDEKAGLQLKASAF